MRYLLVAILVAIAGLVFVKVRDAAPRQDSYDDLVVRNGKVRLRSLVLALLPAPATVGEGTKARVDLDLSAMITEIARVDPSIVRLPIVTNDVCVALNPNTELWSRPEAVSNSVAAYWPIPLKTNGAGRAYLGITFGLGCVWFTNIPAWVPIAISGIHTTNGP